MCLGAPAKVVSIKDNTATVEFGGVNREISVAMVPDVKIGDYVMVHAGYAISVVDEKEALEDLELWKEIMEQ